MASSLGRERREEEESMVPELVACSSHLRPPKPPITAPQAPKFPQGKASLPSGCLVCLRGLPVMWQKLSTEVTNPRKTREGLRVRPSLTSLLLDCTTNTATKTTVGSHHPHCGATKMASNTPTTTTTHTPAS